MLTVTQRRFVVLLGGACMALALPMAVWSHDCYRNYREWAFVAEAGIFLTTAYQALVRFKLSLVMTLLFFIVGLICLGLALRRPPRRIGPGITIEESSARSDV